MNSSDPFGQGQKRKATNIESQVSDKKYRMDAFGATSEPEFWTETEHRLFAEAIYDIGVKNASPSVILENMTEHHEAVTSERVKSHLQKYRNNKAKSKQEFANEYDSWIQRALTLQTADQSGFTQPTAIVNMMGSGKLLGGDLAGFLSYAAMFEDYCDRFGRPEADLPMNATVVQNGTREFDRYTKRSAFSFPVLTEEESKTPLGISIGHVMNLFKSMTQHLMAERLAKETSESESSEYGQLRAYISSYTDPGQPLPAGMDLGPSPIDLQLARRLQDGHQFLSIAGATKSQFGAGTLPVGQQLPETYPNSPVQELPRRPEQSELTGRELHPKPLSWQLR